MYSIGQLVIYNGSGVCRVDAIGPLNMKEAQTGQDYYTLTPIYEKETIFAPVNTTAYMRPIMTKDEAQALIARIPETPSEVRSNNNPRLLNEQYQECLKRHDAESLLRLIRGVYLKGQRLARTGKGKLGQVDRNSMDRAERELHGELAASLGIPREDVVDYIRRAVGQNKNTYS